LKRFHFLDLLWREHICIGEEELQLGSTIRKAIFLELLEKLKGRQKIVFLQQEVDAIPSNRIFLIVSEIALLRRHGCRWISFTIATTSIDKAPSQLSLTHLKFVVLLRQHGGHSFSPPTCRVFTISQVW
jgi:hypothetical protein